MVEEMQERAGAVAKRLGDGGERGDVESHHHGARETCLIGAALDHVPDLVSFLRERLMGGVWAEFTGQGAGFALRAGEFRFLAPPAIFRPAAEVPFAAGREAFPSASSRSSERVY